MKSNYLYLQMTWYYTLELSKILPENLEKSSTRSAMWQDTKSTCTNQKVFLYNNNKHTEKEIIYTLPFTRTPKKIKYLEGSEGFLQWKFKPLKKVIEKDIAEKHWYFRFVRQLKAGSHSGIFISLFSVSYFILTCVHF